ncbi:amidase [Rubellimicrobium sp. CFH 75288]|uniref:amidase n=1 Tax=Rubellimicrobium sp. CFH 75288 TaxID=2697034 RepID=UPI001412F223|nr:amidase [Rubellimicrobium sp. CFH 75288]NAZ36165.1 amidase [Rubellimicrobium sp. CFH 75288]
MTYDDHDALGLAALVASGEASPDELLDEALARTRRLNSHINAVVLIQEEEARRAIRSGLPRGPFRGVPFLLKDLGAEAVGFPSHSGSRLFADQSDPEDSSIVARLRAAGLVIFGRTTAPEGGIGPATEAAVYGGPTRNPWDLSRTPGGSSGGAGAAVAAGIVPAAHGSDGGGSVRIPASNCGLFGLKPTRARLPDGPYAGEGWGGMATDGFLTRSVRDTAALLDACHGADLGAPYHAPPLRRSHMDAISRPPPRLRVGLCETTFEGGPVHPDCAEAARDAARLLEDLGHRVEPFRPDADHAAMIRAWVDIVAAGTALSVRRELRGRDPADWVEGVTRGALAHAATLSAEDYLAALGTIHAYGRRMAAAFSGIDILLSPVMAEPPARIGRFAHDTEDYVAYRLGPEGVWPYSPFCTAFNASGQPAASVPLFWSAEGLPIGVQLAAPFGEDETLLALCREMELARPWWTRRPPPLDSGACSGAASAP